ncbi:hypothetical protein BDW59DRAFT_154128 [Aspergillus cavernicola]|uniref:Uncharacterized protein n=1 Tax=Aspergillus cavernicola TaxID=176166 RepID=A0ABR4HHB5_9EURO
MNRFDRPASLVRPNKPVKKLLIFLIGYPGVNSPRLRQQMGLEVRGMEEARWFARSDSAGNGKTGVQFVVEMCQGARSRNT